MTDPTPAALDARPRPPAGRHRALDHLAGLAAMVGALLFVGGYLAGGGGGSGSAARRPTRHSPPFCDAYDRLQHEYVDQLDSDKLAEGAIRGMFQYGVEDPYSGYMSPDHYQQALGDLSGQFSGIGAEMAVRNMDDPADLEACTSFSDTCRLVVVAPLEDSPAEKAGLQAGDFVTAIDGESVNGTDAGGPDQAGPRRVGHPGDPDARSATSEPLDMTITRADITMQEVRRRMLDGHIGYIALNGFSEPALRPVPRRARRAAGRWRRPVRLRPARQPGRLHRRGQQIASQFIDDGLVFTQESAGDGVRGGRHRRRRGDRSELPVAVLVNSGSASASEIVAAALKERVGRPSSASPPTARTPSSSGAAWRTAAACGSPSAAGSPPITTASRPTGSSRTSTRRAPPRRRPRTIRRSTRRSPSWRTSPSPRTEDAPVTVAGSPSARLSLPAVVGRCRLARHLLASPATKGGGVQMDSSMHATTEAVA